MDFLLSFKVWLVLAAILAAAELFVPGGILLALALASLVVSVSLGIGLIDTWVFALTLWFIVASALLFVMYFFTDRFFSDETRIDNVDEELDIFGKQVKVIEKIGPGKQAGRVEFQGTTWTALSDGSELESGALASIVCKENISLIVEPVKP